MTGDWPKGSLIKSSVSATVSNEKRKSMFIKLYLTLLYPSEELFYRYSKEFTQNEKSVCFTPAKNCSIFTQKILLKMRKAKSIIKLEALYTCSHDQCLAVLGTSEAVEDHRGIQNWISLFTVRI